MALIKAESCLRRYLRSWHSACTQNRTHREQPTQTRQFPSLTQRKPTVNACTVCYVCGLKFLYGENTIKIVILRIQYCKVYKPNQIRFNNNNNNNKLQGPVTVWTSRCCRLLPLFLQLLAIGNGLSLRFTSFHCSWYGRAYESSSSTRRRFPQVFFVDGYKNTSTKYFA